MERPFAYGYWVEPGRLVAGQYPGDRSEAAARVNLRALLSCGVTYFMDLTEEGELAPYAGMLSEEAALLGRPAEHRRFAIRDFSVPTCAAMVATLDALDAALGDGHSVYVHCMGGIGRTGTVVGCYLVRHGLSSQQALERIGRLRHGMPNDYKLSPEAAEQWRMVTRWQG